MAMGARICLTELTEQRVILGNEQRCTLWQNLQLRGCLGARTALGASVPPVDGGE
jgi:hypothetical protein